MKLENQVVSLELAKELKKAGYKQESEYYWITDFSGGYRLKNRDWMNEAEDYELENGEDFLSAPTVAELGERLEKKPGKRMPFTKLPYQLQCEPDYGKGKKWNDKGAKWTGYYKKIKWYMDIKDQTLIELGETTEANARAKMWLYLKKEDLIK